LQLTKVCLRTGSGVMSHNPQGRGQQPATVEPDCNPTYRPTLLIPPPPPPLRQGSAPHGAPRHLAPDRGCGRHIRPTAFTIRTHTQRLDARHFDFDHLNVCTIPLPPNCCNNIAMTDLELEFFMQVAPFSNSLGVSALRPSSAVQGPSSLFCCDGDGAMPPFFRYLVSFIPPNIE